LAGADPSLSRLAQVGLRVASGNRLEFDAEEFREAYDENPALVEQLFTADETGFGPTIQKLLDEMTRDFDGVLFRKNELLGDQQDVLKDRIENMNLILDAKRARLEAQFVGLERSLSALQGQQSALGDLAQLLSA